jgi:hypothetical protein
MSAQKIAEYRAAVKAKHAGKRCKEVDLPSGAGHAYVREPSYEEFMYINSQSDAPHDAYVPAFAKYVETCFAGACDADGEELSFADVRRIAGVGYMVTGPLAAAVNTLAGQVKAPMRDL